MAKVELQNIRKSFGDTLVIDDCSLRIEDKEFLVLVGPSGCGKSTLLRIVAGLEKASSGQILIGDRVVNDIPPKDRHIAMVFQNYALYPHMNVYKNMSFGLRMRKTPKDEIDRQVRRAAKILELDDLLKRKPSQLSGGQRQRVAMGRAIVRNPEVFLFDEPLSNLDAKLRVQMRLEIRKLHERVPTTIIYVTHDQVEAMTLADRIAVIDHGVIQQVGPPEDVYNHPASAFVAGFIGSPPMNFLPVTIEAVDGGFVARAKELSIPISGGDAVAMLKDKKTTLGIRPEHIHLKAKDIDRDIPVSVHCDVVETLGSAVVLVGRIGEDRISALLPAGTKISAHQDVRLYINSDEIKIFDAETGKGILV